MDEAVKQCMAVGLGEVLWDLFPGGKQMGGAPANFAYHAQTLGAWGAVVSAVGDDALGHELLDRLAGCGLDLEYVALNKDYPTGTVSVELDENGKPNYVIHQDVAWDFLPVTPELLALAGRCDAVCFGSLAQRSRSSRDAILRFLDATPSRCLRVFDINLRQSYFNADIVRESLRRSNVLKLNEEELPVVAELLSLSGPESTVLNQLIEGFRLKAVALTRGERGSLLRTPDDEAVHPGCPTARVIDTVGAGDCFAACIAMGLLQGDPLEEISERANRLASYVCSKQGAMPQMVIS